MAIAGKYRRIEMGNLAELDDSTDAAIAALNGNFDSDDFYVARNDGGLEIWLRQLNLTDLSAAVHRAASEYGNREVMTHVLQAVAGIRSYGVNGNNGDADTHDKRAYDGAAVEVERPHRRPYPVSRLSLETGLTNAGLSPQCRKGLALRASPSVPAPARAIRHHTGRNSLSPSLPALRCHT